MKTHGLSRTKEYRAYVRMLHRTSNPSYPGYENYGARGIRVCERWLGPEGFDHFLVDMGKAPGNSRHWSIDRQNNNKGYEPGNCRWANSVEQGNNRRTNVRFEYRGYDFTMAEWARFVGITRKALWKRLRSGWPLEKALAPWPEDEQRMAA